MKVKFLKKLAFIKKVIEFGKAIWLGPELKRKKEGDLINDNLYCRY